MSAIEDLLNHYSYTTQDEENRRKLAEIVLSVQDQFAADFYSMLEENPYTAQYFPTQEAVNKRKKTFKYWLNLILTAPFDHRLHLKLERIGKTHVRIGLDGHYVNAAMNFIRGYCQQALFQTVNDNRSLDSLLDTMNKLLDISLDVMTSSYREAELKKVFLSKQAEYLMVRWAERIMHGLNLVLMIGLLVLAAGVTVLLSTDIYYALTSNVEQGVIRALGSLLILWMMVELLHAQVEQLKGGKFHVRIFVDLAMVAFIRKIFVASIEGEDPWTFGMLIGALLVLGIVYYLLGLPEKK
ncbi:MAG: protoglobin domain-containing protein [Desulfovermiculus sp.]|nr:protoglobin domain-containing protein [Desulfovermiculus sp.]